MGKTTNVLIASSVLFRDLFSNAMKINNRCCGCSFGEQNDRGDREFKVLFMSLLTVSIVSTSGLVPDSCEARRIL